MRNCEKYLMVMFVFLFSTSINSQNNLQHILKAYPDWKTEFDKHIIDLSELRSGGPPKDGIPALFNPSFESFESADNWLENVNPVIALQIGNSAKAYPLQILIWHEIANDKLEETPVIVTFCPLCYSAIVFDRRTNGIENKFGVSGLLRNSDMVMYDQITESFWQQFTGEAIVGEMVGEKLKFIPSQIISYQQFKNNYPDGSVLSIETGYDREYGKNPYVGYDDINQTPFLFDGKIDDRLKPNEKVIGLKLFGNSKAYPYSITEKRKVINDIIGGNEIVIFHSGGAVSALDEADIADSKEAGSTAVFSRMVKGKLLNFTFEENYFYDKSTGSKWSITGKSIEGKFKGKQLARIPFGDYFAFAWFAFQPESEVYSE